MISPTEAWRAVEPIDMRRGIDALSARLRNSLGGAPCAGGAYAFINRARTRLKGLAWDGTGVWLSQRRLHRGGFSGPAADTAVFALSAEQWRWLVAGVQWQRLSAAAAARWRV